MKRIITILLLLLSVAYMLPISAMVKKDTTYSFIDVDEDKDDSIKKEKKVEVVVIDNIVYNTRILSKSIHKLTSCRLFTLFYTIETPPPDLV